VPLPVVLTSFWVASTLAPRERGPEAGLHCWERHLQIIDEIDVSWRPEVVAEN
jgi:hypothetical protein